MSCGVTFPDTQPGKYNTLDTPCSVNFREKNLDPHNIASGDRID